ncbi:MAG: hypothetical protein ABSE16_16405 [Verrucomicrobiota bacterium]|jgi:hypothetical protein
MKKCPPHSTAPDALHDVPALEFPVAPDFGSHPPRVDPQIMLQRIAENMPWRNNRPGESQRRAAEKIPVEFVL